MDETVKEFLDHETSESESEEKEDENSSEDEETLVPQQRLAVTHDGNLDPSLLIRTSGYISKKGGAVNARGGFRTWKKRWFELVPIEDYLDDGSDHLGYEVNFIY